jgi:hypothetical protein
VIPKDLEYNLDRYLFFLEGRADALDDIFGINSVRLAETDVYEQVLYTKLVVTSGENSNAYNESLSRLSIDASRSTFKTGIPSRISRVDVSDFIKRLYSTSMLNIRLAWDFSDNNAFDPVSVAGCVLAFCYIPGVCFDLDTRRRMRQLIVRFMFRADIPNLGDMANSRDEFGFLFPAVWAFPRGQMVFSEDNPLFEQQDDVPYSIPHYLFGRSICRFAIHANSQQEHAGFDDFRASNAYRTLNLLLRRFRPRRNASRDTRAKFQTVIDILTWALERAQIVHRGFVSLEEQANGIASNYFMRKGKFFEAYAGRLADAPVDEAKDPGVFYEGVDIMDPQEDRYEGAKVYDFIPSSVRKFDPVEMIATFVRLEDPEARNPEISIGYALQGVKESVSVISAMAMYQQVMVFQNQLPIHFARKTTVFETVFSRHRSEYVDKIIMPAFKDHKDSIIAALDIGGNYDTVASHCYARAAEDFIRGAFERDDYFPYPGRNLVNCQPPMYVFLAPNFTQSVAIRRGESEIYLRGVAHDNIPQGVNHLSFPQIEQAFLERGFDALGEATFIIGPVPYTIREVSVDRFMPLQESEVWTFGVSNSSIFSIHPVTLDYTVIDADTPVNRKRNIVGLLSTANCIIDDAIIQYFFPPQIESSPIQTYEGRVDPPAFSDMFSIHQKL